MASKTLPLRAALIGLSASAATSWAAHAHLPALLTATGRSKIAIAALLNSNVEAAKAAIQKFELPAETKAYGSPADLAADPDIDLVICNTRVDKHYETILPSVQAGKDVYVEWPIAANGQQIQELIEAARASGSRVAVGLQRRWSPPVLKVKDLLANGSGQLGKVLSTEIRAFGGTIDREVLPASLKYFTQREIGGNQIVIGVGHLLDFVLATLGNLEPSSVHSKAQIQRSTIPIRDPSTSQITEKVSTNVPDLLSFHGTVVASALVAPNATLAFFFRRGQPFPGTPGLTWTINCEHGEVRLLSTGTAPEANPEGQPASIQVHHFADDRVEDVPWSWTEQQKEVGPMARSVMDCLYAFADGKGEGDQWVGLEDAAGRAALIETFLEV